jgi:hypothetical protein
MQRVETSYRDHQRVLIDRTLSRSRYRRARFRSAFDDVEEVPAMAPLDVAPVCAPTGEGG